MSDADPLDLARLDDSMFDRLYKSRIEPCFAENESHRVLAVAQFKQRALIGCVGTIASAALAGVIARDGQVALVIALMVGVVAGIIAYQPLATMGRKLKQEYCSAIAAAMGARYSIGVAEPPAFARMRALSLVPAFSRSSFEDCFSGAHKGASYELYEAHLEQRHSDSKGRTRYSTVFRGQLLKLHFPREFLGTTIVRRDAGVFNAFGGGSSNGVKLERVRLVDSTFERIFEVWGTDQVEARYLVHPVMMERLMDLEKALNGKRIRCAFESGDLLIAVEGGDLFEPGDLFKPLVDPTRARRIVNEVAGVVKVMDHVLTAQAQRPVA